jgi:hypothetical protein
VEIAPLLIVALTPGFGKRNFAASLKIDKYIEVVYPLDQLATE